MVVLSLLIGLALASGDVVAPGRSALDALQYEKALKLLGPVADDVDLPRPTRAAAFLLVAQAHFGIAAPQAEERARSALRSALRLDRSIDFPARADLSPKLVDLFDELRAQLSKAKTPTPKPRPALEEPREIEPDPEPEPAPPSSLSPWLIGAGSAAGIAAVAVVVVAGSELWLGGVPPGTSADSVRGVQAIGAAGVVVAAVAVTAALVGVGVGLSAVE